MGLCTNKYWGKTRFRDVIIYGIGCCPILENQPYANQGKFFYYFEEYNNQTRQHERQVFYFDSKEERDIEYENFKKLI